MSDIDIAGMSRSRMAAFITVGAHAYPPREWKQRGGVVAEAWQFRQADLAEVRNLLAAWRREGFVAISVKEDDESWIHEHRPGMTSDQFDAYLAKAALAFAGTIRVMAKELIPQSPEVAAHTEWHL